MVTIFIFGLCIGSFLNVCIYRIPRGVSLVWPPSHCPRCLSSLRAWENIPLLSYIILKGKCSWCSAPISIRYPLVEAMTAVLTLLLWKKFGMSAKFFLYLSFFSAMIANSLIDLEHYLLFDSLTIPWIFLGIISAFLGLLPINGSSALLGAFIGAGTLSALALISPFLFKKEGMGMGDVKLAASIGAFLGYKSMIVTLLLSFLIGAGVGIFLMLSGKKTAKDYIPFGPCLCIASFLSFLFSEQIISSYLRYIR